MLAISLAKAETYTSPLAWMEMPIKEMLAWVDDLSEWAEKNKPKK